MSVFLLVSDKATCRADPLFSEGQLKILLICNLENDRTNESTDYIWQITEVFDASLFDKQTEGLNTDSFLLVESYFIWQH